MNDSFQRDQFFIRYKNTTEVYWCDSPKPERVVFEDVSDLSASRDSLQWSPLGSYLATFHAKGVILHGGDNFRECGRLGHNEVTTLNFSQNERYALTWNGQVGTANKDAVIVWDIPSNTSLRKFPCISKEWPSFGFSADEQFLATLGANGIGMYVSLLILSHSFTHSLTHSLTHSFIH